MNEAYNFNSLVSKATDKIALLKNYGKDTISFENKLNEIKNKSKISFNTVSNNTGGAAVKSLRSETIYIELSKELNNLIGEIEEDSKYIEIYYECERVKNDIYNNKQECDIDKLISEVLMLITKVIGFNSREIERSNELIKKVYEVAYELIKLELIKKGNSLLLNHINNFNKGKEFITDFVREDLNKLDLNVESNKSINIRLNELYCKGTNYTLSDEKLILEILMRTDDRVKDNIEKMLIKLNERKDELQFDSKKYLLSKLRKVEAKVEINKENLKKKRRNRRIAIAFLLAQLVSFIGIKNKIEKNCTDYTYMTQRTVYDTVDDEVVSDIPSLEHKNGSRLTTVKVYGSVEEGYRYFYTYDASNVDLDSIEEYVECDTSNFSQIDSGYIRYSLIDQKSKDEYKVVEKVNYDEDATITFDEERYQKNITITTGVLGGLSLIELLITLKSLLNTLKLKRIYIDLCCDVSDKEKELEKIDDEISKIKQEIKNIENRKSELEVVEKLKVLRK